MGEALKELGKLFYNLALISIAWLIFQPLVKTQLKLPLIVLAFVISLISVAVGFYLITYGNKLSQKEG